MGLARAGAASPPLPLGLTPHSTLDRRPQRLWMKEEEDGEESQPLDFSSRLRQLWEAGPSPHREASLATWLLGVGTVSFSHFEEDSLQDRVHFPRGYSGAEPSLSARPAAFSWLGDWGGRSSWFPS